jgi:hypothetical protein
LKTKSENSKRKLIICVGQDRSSKLDLEFPKSSKRPNGKAKLMEFSDVSEI